MQGQDAAGHPVNIARLRPARPGRPRSHAVGGRRPDGTAPEQLVAGNQRHRSKCRLSAAGEKKVVGRAIKGRMFQLVRIIIKIYED